MAKFKLPKISTKTIVAIALVAVLIPVVLWVWKLFAGKKKADAATVAFEERKEEIARDVSDMMQCGLSYGDMAEQLYSLIFGTDGLFGFFKNTDEKEVGRLMGMVQPSEYAKLGNVYYAMKLADIAAAPFWKLVAGRTESLTADLKGTFSAKEWATYMAKFNISYK